MEEYKPIEKLELKRLDKELPKVFKKVNCPSCEKVVAADNLNLQNSVAKCGSCNVIFSIEEEVEKVKSKKGMKQEVFRPEGIDLFSFKDDLEITVQQHVQGVNAIGSALFVPIAFLTLMIYFFGEKSISPYIPIVISMIASYFVYQVSNTSKNKTYVDINNQSLSIKSRPKNFKKDKTYTVDEIDQLYLKNAADGSGYFSIYMIVNGMEGQKHEKLLTLNTLSKAKYLEQEIERYLSIEDRKVPEANA